MAVHGPVPRCYSALLLPRLVGDAGLAWLGQEPVAMRELATYFGEGPGELRAIAVEAATRVGLAINALAPEAAPAVEEWSSECEHSDRTPTGCEPTDVQKETRAEQDGPAQPAADPKAPSPAQPPEPIGGEGAGWR